MRISHDTTLRRKQSAAVAGALAALMVICLTLEFRGLLAYKVAVPVDHPASRLAFVARWLVGPGLTLLAGVQGAARRGFFADAIDGTRTPADRSLEINLRYNLNTLEQIVLAAIAWSALAAMLARSQLGIIPVMAALFVVGRIAFWAGYPTKPVARAFGMTLTVLPTICTYAWLIFQRIAA